MSDVMQRMIMDRLLERYEKSRAFTGGSARLYLDSKRDGEIFSKLEDYDFKVDFLGAARKLEKEGLVHVEWLKGEEDNLPERIRLTALDNGLADRAYEVVGRMDLSRSLASLREELTSFSRQCPCQDCAGQFFPFSSFHVAFLLKFLSLLHNLPDRSSMSCPIHSFSPITSE